MYKHIGKVVNKILQGSAVTQTALGGLSIFNSKNAPKCVLSKAKSFYIFFLRELNAPGEHDCTTNQDYVSIIIHVRVRSN